MVDDTMTVIISFWQTYTYSPSYLSTCLFQSQHIMSGRQISLMSLGLDELAGNSFTQTNSMLLITLELVSAKYVSSNESSEFYSQRSRIAIILSLLFVMFLAEQELVLLQRNSRWSPSGIRKFIFLLLLSINESYCV